MKTNVVLGTIIFNMVIVGLFCIPYHVYGGEKVYTNSIGMKFVLISAGSFYMGSCKESAALNEKNKKRKFLGQAPLSVPCPSGGGSDNDASDNETPQHKVSIGKAFYMGMYEVTVGQFKKFIVDKGRDDLLSDNFIKANSHGDNAAVSYISWGDAKDFISWLDAKESGNRYRLPSEAEWEYACRAGTTTRYSFGNSKGILGSHAWYNKNAYDVGAKYVHAVGKKQPNPWGMYDMHGNIWEWCQDWYGKNYYSRSPSSNPVGPSSGSIRVGRGGSWSDHARDCRSADRYFASPGYRGDYSGFRLVLSLGQ